MLITLSAPALCFAQDVAPTAIIEQLLPLAQKGDPKAQTALGDLYFEGNSVPQDYKQAELWYSRSAAQGDPVAQYALGQLFATGLGVTQDYKRAAQWFDTSAKTGTYPLAHHALAMIYEGGLGRPKNYKMAANHYSLAANMNVIQAITSLGVLYQNGQGVSQDYEKARELYTQAAKQNDARAQNNLGILYTKALGVDQDYALAAQWYKKAADQGLSTAMTNLGVLYENGFGVELDEEKSRRLYRLAGQKNVRKLEQSEKGSAKNAGQSLETILQGARAGNAQDQYNLVHLLEKDDAQISSTRKPISWLKSSAEQGYAPAMTLLARRYADGRGVPQDFVLGYMWANLAMARGDNEAKSVREALAKFMTSNSINIAQKLSREWTPSLSTAQTDEKSDRSPRN